MLHTLNFYHSSLEDLALRKGKQNRKIYISPKELKTIVKGAGR